MSVQEHDDLVERCQAIELLVTDVDGVLTNGVIALDDNGVETKHFYVRDGMAFTLWRRAGKKAAILSSRSSLCVQRRATELKIEHVLQGYEHKGEPFRTLIGGLGLSPKQVCFVGDDLGDLPILKIVGLAACPSDASIEVKDLAHLVATAPGGRGAVREVVEVILKSQGSWNELIGGIYVPLYVA